MNSDECMLLAAHSQVSLPENKGYLCGQPSTGCLFFILFITVFHCVHVCHGAYVVVRGQLTEGGSPVPPYWSPGIKPGSSGLATAPLPTESSW